MFEALRISSVKVDRYQTSYNESYGGGMAKIPKGRPVLTSIGILKEYTIRICRCKKHVCSIEDLKEYEIFEKEQKTLNVSNNEFDRAFIKRGRRPSANYKITSYR